MTFHELSRAIGFYLHAMGALLGVAVYFISLAVRNEDNPLLLALGIQLVTQFIAPLQFVIRLSSDLESYLSAMSRCLEYTRLKTESPLKLPQQKDSNVGGSH